MNGKLMTTRRDTSLLFRNLGSYHRRKDWFNFLCPFHHGSKRNFGVNLRTSWYSCFSCGESGSLRTLRERLPGLFEGEIPLDVPLIPSEWLESTSPWPGDTSGKQVLVSRNSEWFWSRYNRLISVGERMRTVQENIALKYLRTRGVDVGRYEVGLLKGSEGRIVFPFLVGDDVSYYQGRAFVNMPLKTLNPSEEDGWPSKSQVIWNYNGIYDKDTIVLCEGIFDAISIETRTELPATCLLGKTISLRQKTLLRNCGVQNIVVFLDSDAQKDAWKLGIDLYYSKFNARVVTWEKREQTQKLDPGNLPGQHLKYKLILSQEVDFQTELALLAGSL